MTMTIPTIPTLSAGYVVTAADMNNLSACATFMLNKPIASVHDGLGTQTITTSASSVAFNTKDFDTDGMWSSGANTQFTVQTPGFYKIAYSVATVGSSTAYTLGTSVVVTTGANNPLGAGISQLPIWQGYGSALTASSLRVVARNTGIIPYYMFIGDYVQVKAVAVSTMTLSTYIPSFMCLEYVSTLCLYLALFQPLLQMNQAYLICRRFQ